MSVEVLTEPSKTPVATALAKLGSGYDRTQYIGGSDIAAILGLSKWRTPLELYFDKTNPAWRANKLEDDERRARILKRGKKLEPVVVEMLEEEHGIEVTRLSTDEMPNRYVDGQFPWMAAEIDFEFKVTQQLVDAMPEGFIDPALVGTIQNGEIKTVYPLAAHLWGEEFTEDVPIDYAAQSMHGLGVTGRDICLYGVLFGADNLTLYIIRRDEETIAGIRQKVVAFRENHLLAGVEPDPLNMADMKYLLAKFNGIPVELDPETKSKFDRFNAIGPRVTALTDEKERLMFEICDEIRKAWGKPDIAAVEDDAQLTFDGQVIGSWKKQRGTFLDQKRLARENPDLSKSLTVEHWYRVLRAKKTK